MEEDFLEDFRKIFLIPLQFSCVSCWAHFSVRILMEFKINYVGLKNFAAKQIFVLTYCAISS